MYSSFSMPLNIKFFSILISDRKKCKHFIQELQLGYLNQCHAGETITVETAQQDGICYARGIGPGGDERFDCSLSLSALAGGAAPF